MDFITWDILSLGPRGSHPCGAGWSLAWGHRAPAPVAVPPEGIGVRPHAWMTRSAKPLPTGAVE